MAKVRKTPRSKIEPAEQVAGDNAPRTLSSAAQQVVVCAKCGEQVGDTGKIVALNPKLVAEAPTESLPQDSVVTIATLVLLAGLAALVAWHIITPEMYFHMFWITMVSIFVVPYGVGQLPRIIKKLGQ